MAANKTGFMEYIKTAFMNHWNLLAFGACLVGGALSGQADVVLPLVAAAEIAYLTSLSIHPKFQSYVNAQAHKAGRAQVKGEALDRIFESLDPRSRSRFEELRRRCRDLQSLAGATRAAESLGEVASMHNEGINRLLWVFLKLLYSKRSMERFLETTNEDSIRADIKKVELRISALGPAQEDQGDEPKMRRTLEDTLASAQARLENLLKAQSKHELVQLELDRIDAKITSIAEMAVNRQEPDFITSEVDGVAATMEQTERAMGELQFLSGLDDTEVVPPSFIDEDMDLN